MKRLLVSAGLMCALTGFVWAQENANANPASGAPQGTVVKKKETTTIVQPQKAPIQINSSVIESAQRALKEKGYDPGPIDGKMGAQTREAIQKFQADQNLNQTGKLDQKTLAALNVGGIQELKASTVDLERGGKAIGHNTVGGHPVAAGKAAVKGGKDFGVKVGEGAESTAVKAKDKVAAGITALGNKISGQGKKLDKAGETGSNAQENAGAEQTGGVAGAASSAGQQTGNAAENTGEQAGAAASNAGQQTGEAAENAGQQTGNAVEEAGEATGNAAQKVGTETKQGAEKAGNAVGNAAGTVKKKTENAAQDVKSGVENKDNNQNNNTPPQR